MPVSRLNRHVIEAAILGFEQQKHQIDEEIAELRAMLTDGPAGTTAATPQATPGKRKKFSAVARRKMALAQKARWAKIKGESEKPAPAQSETPKQKRQISPEGMKRIIAANKKMWAARRSAAKAKLAATKKTSPAKKKGALKKAAAKSAQVTAPAAATA